MIAASVGWGWMNIVEDWNRECDLEADEEQILWVLPNSVSESESRFPEILFGIATGTWHRAGVQGGKEGPLVRELIGTTSEKSHGGKLLLKEVRLELEGRVEIEFFE